VKIGAGCLWSEIYDFLKPYELEIIGGICTGIGAGGYSLVGGCGWMTGAHGVAVDSIISTTVVLSTGQVVNCPSSQNTDLFWAICGAGPCFGIVIEFVMRVFLQPNLVWNGAMMFGKQDLKAVLGVANKVMDDGNWEGKAAMNFTWGIPANLKDGEVRIIVLICYNGPEEDAREFFGSLLELEPVINTTTMKPFAESGIPGVSRHGVWRKCAAGGSLMVPFDVAIFEELGRISRNS
jgi:FAD/FMN-containing dehydrogenase